MRKSRKIKKETTEGLADIKKWRHNKKLKIKKSSLPTASHVAQIRYQLELTQQDFATLLGVSIATLRNWEQKRREPHGPARCLLLIAKKVPTAFLKALQSSGK